MLYLEYKFAAGYSPEKTPDCDKGAKAYANMMVIAAKHVNSKRWYFVWMVWLMSRVYFRKLTATGVEYRWPLFPTDSSIPNLTNDTVRRVLQKD